MSELISCITPTCNREWCLPHAIAQFQAQTYKHKELIVLDNGSRSVEHLVPDEPNIHYHRATSKFTGPLRNEAIGYASGDVISHWDDDDLHHPEQLSYYRGVLGNFGADITGSDAVIFHNPATGENWLYKFKGIEDWIHGSTLMYRRKVWERTKFRGHVTEDMYWLGDIAGLGYKFRAAYPWPMQVNLIHENNICKKDTTRPFWHALDELPEWTRRAEYRDLLNAKRG